MTCACCHAPDAGHGDRWDARFCARCWSYIERGWTVAEIIRKVLGGKRDSP